MAVLKIGVLTFHRCINYGSYWQARCLAEGLQAMGHNAVILDHHSPRVNLAEWKCALQPVLPTAVPKKDQQLYRQKTEKFFNLFEGLPLSPRFNLDRPDEMQHYDVVVVGSDEVWNLFHPWYGKHPLFWGEGLKANRIISYAASFGNYPAEWGIDGRWTTKLKNFDSISVRDENSKNIVFNATGLEPQIVLDPCLQFPVTPDERPAFANGQPYAAVYGHNFTTSFIQKKIAWARQAGLPLVSIGYRNDWADEQWLTADPHDFAQFMSGAQAVVTNFFHGCVFALRNQKAFACETTQYRSIKVQGLMQKVGGEQHLITNDTGYEQVNHCLNTPLRPEIAQNIARLRSLSNQYLQQALGAKTNHVHASIV